MRELKTCHTVTWESSCALDVYVCLWGIGVIFNKNYPVTSFPSKRFPKKNLTQPLNRCLACHFTLGGMNEWNVGGAWGSTEHEDLIPNFEDVLSIGIGGKEETICRLEKIKLPPVSDDYFFPWKVKKKKKMAEGEEGKGRKKTFKSSTSLPPPFPALSKSSIFHKLCRLPSLDPPLASL